MTTTLEMTTILEIITVSEITTVLLRVVVGPVLQKRKDKKKVTKDLNKINKSKKTILKSI